MTTDTAPAGEPIVRLVRTYNAPVDVVYRAWTDPEQLKQWWGPTVFTNPVCVLDVRPGGVFHIEMRSPDGTIYPCDAVFREVVPNARLVYRMQSDPSYDWPHDMPPDATHEITFEAIGNTTRLTVIARLDSIELRDKIVDIGFTEGMGQSLDKLATILAPGTT